MTINEPTLFKFSSTNKIQQWDIESNELPDGSANIVVRWGQQGGLIQTTTTRVSEGKNIGKSNETSPFAQAKSEAKSKWKKQLDRGYSPGAAKVVAQTNPMLAKSYDKERKKVKFPCFYQPKLDGMRCVAQKLNGKVSMVSRRGKPIDTLPHINSLLEALMDEGEIVDGELYTHGVEFQKVMSWIKRNQPDSARVQYNLYDVINDKPYKERFKRLCLLVGNRGQDIIRTTYTDIVRSHKEVDEAHDAQCVRGFEGIMLRIGDCQYKCGKRSSELLKVKKFMDEEFKIVGAFENVGKQEGQCTFSCVTKDGGKFNVKPQGTAQEREKYWEDFQKGLIKGKMLTVRFFEWTTSTPKVPRFPVGVIIRDYE